MSLVGTAPWLADVGEGIRQAALMFWETLWALVLGFALSGVVQRFAPREAMQRRLGDHGPRAVARASGYGMASSSCSYAASAMAKSLVAKGADFVAAMVFMFASTNLVIELGLVLLALLGWQFLAAQFVGGVVMIVLLALVGGAVLGGRLVAQARRRLEAGDPTISEDTSNPADSRRGSLAAWSDAASYAVGDATMLRRELLVGFTVAGFLAALVPASAWDRLFLHGHGVWTSVENALVAPLIAVVSFVCSIGNVPLAAALWKGGISFGGVIAFIFADLIAMPLLLVYRKYYGTRLAVRMLIVFYCVIVVAGIVVGGLFSAAGLAPAAHPTAVVPAHFEWDYTAFLNIVFLGVAAAIYALHRRAPSVGGGAGLATDPVCGMQVRVLDAPASTVVEGVASFFCSDRCCERFLAAGSPSAVGAPEAAIDPVCGMEVGVEDGAVALRRDGVLEYFCCEACRDRFAASGVSPDSGGLGIHGPLPPGRRGD